MYALFLLAYKDVDFQWVTRGGKKIRIFDSKKSP